MTVGELKQEIQQFLTTSGIRKICRTVCKGRCCKHCGQKRGGCALTEQPVLCASFLCDDLFVMLLMMSGFDPEIILWEKQWRDMVDSLVQHHLGFYLPNKEDSSAQAAHEMPHAPGGLSRTCLAIIDTILTSNILESWHSIDSGYLRGYWMEVSSSGKLTQHLLAMTQLDHNTSIIIKKQNEHKNTTYYEIFMFPVGPNVIVRPGHIN